MEHLLIRDVETGKTLTIWRQFPDSNYVVQEDLELKDVRERSIYKVLREWMKDRKNDISCG